MEETKQAQVKRDEQAAVVELEKGLPKSAIKQHPYTKFDYVDPVYVISTANEVFGYGGWRSEVVNAPHVVDRYTRKKDGGENVVAIVACTVRVHALGTFHDGQGMGTADAPLDTFAGNLDKAFKEAETDALKRAFIKYGDRFALTLYDKDKANRNIVDDDAPRAPDAKTDPVAHWKARLAAVRTKSAFTALWNEMKTAWPGGRDEIGEWGEQIYNALPDVAPAERPKTSTWSLKFGNKKGIALADLEDRDLSWYAEKLEGDLSNPEKAQYHESTRKNLDAVRAEQAWRRANQGQRAA